MKQVLKTVKVAALLLSLPIAIGVWMVLGPDGVGWVRGVRRSFHGMGWSVIVVYGGVAVWLISMSYYDEVIRPRKLRRQQLLEVEKQQRRAASMKYFNDADQRWKVK